MKGLIILFLLIIIPLAYNIYPQNQIGCKISGNVFDSKTKKPVADVNIYLAGSLYGTTTDLSGDYNLTKIPSGDYKLVVSRIGYEPVVLNVSLDDETHLTKTFYLNEKIYDLDEITVKAEEPDKWKDQLETFKKYFFGLTEYSANCSIENEFDLDFKEGEQNELIAYAEKPLRIINKSLGFAIYCELVDFKYNPGTQMVHTLYYPYFQELEPSDAKENRYWKKNRKSACYISLNRILIAMAKSSYRLKEYVLEKCAGFSFDCEPIQPKQIPIIFDPETRLYTVSFPYHLKITNRITGNDSYVTLPYGYAQFDKYGFVQRAYSVEVIGEFAKLGISSALPQELYDDILISDLLERL